MKNIIENIVKEKTNFPIKAIIPYGSTVYKNKTASDHDFIVIVDSNEPFHADIHGRNDIDISIYDWNFFINRVNENKVRELELIFTPFDSDNYYLENEVKKVFLELRKSVIDKTKIRHNFSKKTSNSYVKAKKKIIVEADYEYMTSLKSLWHSIRMADFAIQIVSKGEIDFKSCNELYKEIETLYSTEQCADKNEMWANIHSKIRPIFNKKSSELKALCPKG